MARMLRRTLRATPDHLLTTEAIVTEMPEKKEAPHTAGGGGGMGGMGGMDY